MSAVEGSLGFLPRRILVDPDRARRARRLLRDAGLARELRDGEAPRGEPASTRSSAAAEAAPAARGPSRRRRRDPARRGGRRAGRAAWSTSAQGSARSASRSCSAGPRRAATSSRSTPRSPRWRGATPRSTALPSAPASSSPTRLTPPRGAARARRRGGRPRRHQSALLRAENRSRLAGCAPRPRPCRGGGRGAARRLARASLALLKPGGRFVDDPARRRAAGAAAGLRRSARRPRPAPRSPARRRAGDPAADFRDEGSQRPSACACPA